MTDSWKTLQDVKKKYEKMADVLDQTGLHPEYEFLRPIFQNILTVLALYDMDWGIIKDCYDVMISIADEFYRSVVKGPVHAQPFERLSTMRMNLIFGEGWDKEWQQYTQQELQYESDTYMRSVAFNRFIESYMQSTGNLNTALHLRIQEQCGDGTGNLGESAALATAILEGLDQICNEIGTREEDQDGWDRVENRNYRNQWRSENYIRYIIIVLGFWKALTTFAINSQALEDKGKQMPWPHIRKRLTPRQRRTHNQLTRTERGTYRTIGQEFEFNPNELPPGVGFTIVEVDEDGGVEPTGTWESGRGLSRSSESPTALLGPYYSCSAIVQIPSPTAQFLVKTAYEMASYRLSAFREGGVYYQPMTLGELFNDDNRRITLFIQRVVLQQVKLPMFKLACEDLDLSEGYDFNSLTSSLMGAGLGAGTVAFSAGMLDAFSAGTLGVGVPTTSVASIAAGVLSSMHVDYLRSSLPSLPSWSPPSSSPPPPPMTKIQKLQEVARIIDQVIDQEIDDTIHQNLQAEAEAEGWTEKAWSVIDLEGWTKKAMKALRGNRLTDFEKLLKQWAKSLGESLQNKEISEVLVWKQLEIQTKEEHDRINRELPQLKRNVEESDSGFSLSKNLAFLWDYWWASDTSRQIYHDTRLVSHFVDNTPLQIAAVTVLAVLVAQRCMRRPRGKKKT